MASLLGNGFELVRADQCQFGLVGARQGLPVLKPTGFLVTQGSALAENLAVRCTKDHEHEQLIGGIAKHAQVWPAALGKVIASSARQELAARSKRLRRLAAKDGDLTDDEVRE
eukprot:710917-Lingulodinium_polyedra.AAC.1